jgi:hypothetical protein
MSIVRFTLTLFFLTAICSAQVEMYEFQNNELKKEWYSDSTNWLLKPTFSLVDQKTLLGTAVNPNGEYIIKQIHENVFQETYKSGVKKRKIFGPNLNSPDSIHIYHPITQNIFCIIKYSDNKISSLSYPTLKKVFSGHSNMIYFGFDGKKKLEIIPSKENEEKVIIYGTNERKIGEGKFYFGRPHGTWSEYLSNGSFIKYQWAMGYMLTVITN